MYYIPKPIKATDRILLKLDDLEVKSLQNLFSLQERVILNDNSYYMQYDLRFKKGQYKDEICYIIINKAGEHKQKRCKICQVDDCHHIYYLNKIVNDKYELVKENKDWQTERNALLEQKKQEEILRIEVERKEKLRSSGLAKIQPLLEVLTKDDNLPLKTLVKFYPIIEFKGSYVLISLKVGIDKVYSVQNLVNFLKAFNNGDQLNLGKSLSFKALKTNIDNQARSLYEVLIDVNYVRYNVTYNNKDIRLNFEGLDKVFQIYKGGQIYFKDGRNEHQITLELNPLLVDLYIDDNYILKHQGLDEYDVLSLPFNHYALKNNCLSQIKTKNELMLPLFDFAIKNEDFSFSEIKDILSRDIISRFPDDIKIDSKIKDEVKVIDVLIKAYFDYDNGVITCNLKYFLEDVETSFQSITESSFLSLKSNKLNHHLNALGFINDKIENEGLVYQFLSANLEPLMDLAEIYLSDKIKRLSVTKYNPIKVRLGYNVNLLSVVFEDSEYSDDELAAIIKGIRKKTRYVKLNKERIIEVNEDDANKLLKTIDELKLDINKLHQTQNVPLYQLLKLKNNQADLSDLNFSDNLKGLLNEIANYKNANYTIPEVLKNVLRGYQVEAFMWLKTLIKFNFSGILADDMGLGKTLEMISVLLSDEIDKPSLIICPKSLAFNWKNEFGLWAKSLDVKVIMGSVSERNEDIKQIKKDKKQFIITSYDMLRNDLELYQEYEFRFIILDEAQHIKNKETLKAQSVKNLNTELRFVLTGTPIENSVSDLWSIFDFLMSGYLGSYEQFRQRYEKGIVEGSDKSYGLELSYKVAPFILRRNKMDVLKELPEKIEIIQTAKMYPSQQLMYDAELKRTRDILNNPEQSKITLLAALTRLRQICVDPGMYLEHYTGGSGKIDLLLELIDDYIASNHRLLIFSQFTTIFESIGQELKKKRIEYYQLTGKTSAIDRVNMATNFNQEDKIKVFLVSLKAGGTGLNLIGADIVIHLDPWWNFAVESQASDRAHRIGQKRNVEVVKLIMENSIEQKVIELQERKKEIAKLIIADDDSALQKLSNDDFRFLLD